MRLTPRRASVFHSENETLDERLVRLQRKVRADRLNVPEDVIQYVAQRSLVMNERAVTALMRVIAFASLKRQEITVPLASTALDESTVSVPIMQRVSAESNGYASPFPISSKDLSRLVENEMDQVAATTEPTPSSQRRYWDGMSRRLRPARFITWVKSWWTTLPNWLTRREPVDQTNARAGVLEGFIVSAGGTLAMLGTCLIIDYTCHGMKLVTLSVGWIWWAIIGLNASTALIPFDLARHFFRQRKSSPRAGTRSTTLLMLSGLTTLLFLVILFHEQTMDVSIMRRLGLLN